MAADIAGLEDLASLSVCCINSGWMFLMKPSQVSKAFYSVCPSGYGRNLLIDKDVEVNLIGRA